MALDELCQLIETLRERAQIYQADLARSEALTRQALVEPLLRGLGWNTEDPSLMRPEYRLGDELVDYALLSGGKPAVVVETKKLSVPLAGVANRRIGYCAQDGISCFAVTDGRRWELHQTRRPVPRSDRGIVSFDVVADPLSRVCLNALSLWRLNIEEGEMRPAQQPLTLREGSSQLFKLPEPPGPEPSGNWRSLTDVPPPTGNNQPREIRFPDGSREPLKAWVDVPRAIVRWLQRQDRLEAASLPVKYASRYVLASSPFHPSGKEFDIDKRQRIGLCYYEAAHQPVNEVRNAKLIIEQVGIGVSADQFRLRLPD